MSAEVVVTGLAIAPIKGMRLQEVQRISLELTGVRENRRFYLIDQHDRMINAKVVGELQQIVADYSDATRRLTLTLPDGTVIEDEVRPGERTATRFFSRTSEGRLVEGPWSAAVSAHLGRQVRLVEAGESGAVDRGGGATVSVISRASLSRLARAAGENGNLDGRRFRMLIEVDGVAAHGEDQWVGRTVRFGGAQVEFCGHVGRCLVTSRDPDTGSIDLPTLDLLGTYRSGLATSEPLPFGIHGRPMTAGQVAVGDPVVLDG